MKKYILVVATLPPPETGMTAATRAVVDRLKKVFSVEVINISSKRFCRGISWKVAKLVLSLLAVVRLAFLDMRRYSAVYLVPNSGFGLIYTLLLVLASGRARLVMHHHVFSYLTQKSMLMSLVHGFSRGRTLHIFLSRGMRQKYFSQYGETKALVLGNAIFLQDDEGQSRRREGAVVLGFLSNLVLEKGLAEVLSAFEASLADGLDVRLVLAGPLKNTAARDYLRPFLERLGDRIEYRGPVYGQDKKQFFREIELFLFPSKYRNEAQPLVVYEALSAGVPVLVSPVGCLPELADGKGCEVFSPGKFSDGVVARVRTLQGKTREEYQHWARKLWCREMEASSRQLSDLMAAISGDEEGAVWLNRG